MKRLRVYLSSTFEDLREFRSAAFDGLDKAGLEVARMESYTAADARPLDLCLADLRTCDIYVGIFAWRYGYTPPAAHGNASELSITELEYREADRCGLTKLVFLSHHDTEHDWAEKFNDEAAGRPASWAKLMRLRDEVAQDKVASFFRTPEELALLVLAAIMRGGLGGRPYNIPVRSLAPVLRAALTRDVVAALTGSDGRSPRNSVLCGPGGFGKTTLAISVGQSPDVVRAFPDGLLWTSLGENPDLEQALRELYVALTGTSPVAQGVRAIGDAIGRELRGRRCLVVLDDVWHVDHLTPFTTVGAAHLLVTTRHRTLLEEAGQHGWQEIPVDEMTADEAGALLGRGLPDGRAGRQEVDGLAAQLGCWPLLLELANARLREEYKSGRGGPDECVRQVGRLLERRGVYSLDRRNSSARNGAIANSIEVGLDWVEHRFPGVSGQAMELGAFPENTPVPVPVLADLWAMSPFDVEEDVLRPLDGIGLLRWDRANSAVELHMIVHRALRARLRATAPGGSAEVNAKLVRAWGDPFRLPHDYAWRWFPWHCLEAGLEPELRRLLADFDWMRAKLAATEISALIHDYELLADDATIARLHVVLLAAAQILARLPAELATQLVGRMVRRFDPDDRRLVEHIEAAAPRPWLRPLNESLASPALLRTLWLNQDVQRLAITDDLSRIMSVGRRGEVAVWDANRGTALPTDEWDEAQNRSLSMSVTRPPEPRSTELEEREFVQWWSPLGSGWIAVLGRTLTWGGTDRKDYRIVVNADGERPRADWRTIGSFSDLRFGSATLARSSGLVVTSSFLLGTVLWDVDSAKRVGFVPTGLTSAMACSPNGAALATAGKDGFTKAWRMDRLVGHAQSGPGHTKAVLDVDVSPDGRIGYSASVDGTVKSWDLGTAEEIAEIPAAAHWVDGSSAEFGISRATVDATRGHVSFVIHDTDFTKTGGGQVHTYDLLVDGPVARPDAEIERDSVVELRDLYRKALEASARGDLKSELAARSTQLLGKSTDPTRALTVSPEGTVWVWDTLVGRKLASVTLGSPPRCGVYTQGSEVLILGDESGHVHILMLEV